MFLRRYSRLVGGKRLTYFALVETVRTEAGPRQQVVAHLGELNADQQRRWQRTITFHNLQGEARPLRLFPDDDHVPLPDDPDVVRIRLALVGRTNPRRFGDVWLAWWLWRYLRLDEIVARYVPQGDHTVRPADIVAIEVINRLCGPCSEFALAEHWYASTGLDDLLGIPDSAITKDRLYRTLDGLRRGQQGIENDLRAQFGTLFRLEFDLLLYDLTSTCFEGLVEENVQHFVGLAQPKEYAQDGLQGIGLEIDEQEQQLLLRRVQHPLAAATREPLAGLACQGLVGEATSFVAPRERAQQLLELGKRQPGEGQKLPSIALKF